MEELTFDEVVKKYDFKKADIDKIMKRTKPQTEVDGIRILMKEGERRKKLKQAYADRMARRSSTDAVEAPAPAEDMTVVDLPNGGQCTVREVPDDEDAPRTFRGNHPITGNPQYR